MALNLFKQHDEKSYNKGQLEEPPGYHFLCLHYMVFRAKQSYGWNGHTQWSVKD